ncbi:MAG: ABC transporter permease subunit [Euryarchaeota archaeon]|nr:ABC transporter permease subunit [Euryarchaeota archaeon]
MDAKRLFNVAGKEFIDHITSKKFILILALFLIISAVAMEQGIGDYNNRLEDYKEQISQVGEEEEGFHPMPRKPSILFIFQRMRGLMPFLGAILAIAMGFDLITREKERGSLKSLLSHPVYRDEIINGKAVGGILAIVFAVGIAFLILFAMLLLFSIVPDLDEFWRIALFGAVTVLCLLTYFSIALMASTVSKDSGRALMYAFIIVLALSFAMPMIGGIVVKGVVGEPPERPVIQSRIEINEYGEFVGHIEPMNKEEEEEWERYSEELKAYSEKKWAIQDAFEIFSPDSNYMAVSISLTNPYLKVVHGGSWSSSYTPGETTSIQESLEKVWKSILALIILPVVFFPITYIKFMRMDIR